MGNAASLDAGQGLSGEVPPPPFDVEETKALLLRIRSQKKEAWDRYYQLERLANEADREFSRLQMEIPRAYHQAIELGEEEHNVTQPIRRYLKLIERERRSGYRSLSQADLDRFHEEQLRDPLYRLINNLP